VAKLNSVARSSESESKDRKRCEIGSCRLRRTSHSEVKRSADRVRDRKIATLAETSHPQGGNVND